MPASVVVASLNDINLFLSPVVPRLVLPAFVDPASLLNCCVATNGAAYLYCFIGRCLLLLPQLDIPASAVLATAACFFCSYWCFLLLLQEPFLPELPTSFALLPQLVLFPSWRFMLLLPLLIQLMLPVFVVVAIAADAS